MAKNKLAKFAEMETLENVFQPTHEEVFRTDYKLKGKWGEQVFGNDHPIVLEVGCGKGEYSVGLGELYPEKNFIGLDIKGSSHVDRGESGKRKRHEKRCFPTYTRGRTGIYFRTRRSFRNLDYLSRPSNGKSPQTTHGNPFSLPVPKVSEGRRPYPFENRQPFPLSIHGRTGQGEPPPRERQHG